MANPCGGLTTNPYNGDICQHGYISGILMSESKLAAQTETAAASQSTWDTLLLADQPDRLFSINFDKLEPGENEVVQEEMADGSQVIIQVKQATHEYQMISSNTALRTIYKEFKDGKEMYAWFKTDKGFIVGKEVTQDTIEQVKIRVYSTYTDATNEETAKVTMQISYLEDWKEFQNAVDPDFDPKSLSSVRDMTFRETGTTSTTAVSVIAKDFDKIGITALSRTGAGNFTVYNETTTSSVTVTGITGSGSTYILAFAAQSSADVLTIGYDEPSTTSEYYDLSSDLSVTIP
jgi:glucosamine 6-phosphate synthetase-like amidotransferase/phosphosugar isomerase protein